MDPQYDYIQIVEDDDWGLVEIVPSNNRRKGTPTTSLPHSTSTTDPNTMTTQTSTFISPPLTTASIPVSQHVHSNAGSSMADPRLVPNTPDTRPFPPTHADSRAFPSTHGSSVSSRSGAPIPDAKVVNSRRRIIEKNTTDPTTKGGAPKIIEEVPKVEPEVLESKVTEPNPFKLSTSKSRGKRLTGFNR